MGQSRKHSLIESCANVASGVVIAFGISQIAHWLEPQIRTYIWSGFEWKISVGSNIIMTIVLTIVSILRGYAWRRHFNRRTTNETTKK